MRKRSPFLLALSATLLIAGSAHGISGFGLQVPISYRSWDIADSSLSSTTSQWVVPFQGVVSVSDAIDVIDDHELTAELHAPIGPTFQARSVDAARGGKVRALAHPLEPLPLDVPLHLRHRVIPHRRPA